MNAKTKKFLDACAKAGYLHVAIGMRHRGVPHSLTYSFGVENSVFTWPNVYSKDRGFWRGWPAIWEIVDRLGIGYGAGNEQQHFLKKGHGLEPGFYIRSPKGKFRLYAKAKNARKT